MMSSSGEDGSLASSLEGSLAGRGRTLAEEGSRSRAREARSRLAEPRGFQVQVESHRRQSLRRNRSYNELRRIHVFNCQDLEDFSDLGLSFASRTKMLEKTS